MTYCVAPGCPKPDNPDQANFCQRCGAKLILQGRYRPIKPLGQGGFGQTFLGVDTQIPSLPPCAIKQFCFTETNQPSYQKALALFQQEAQHLEKLGQLPQIPQLLAYFSEQNSWYLVQEFIAGSTLKQELEENGNFSEAQIWQLLKELLPVLKFIHDRHIIHRDIKPANIMRRTMSPYNYNMVQAQYLTNQKRMIGQIVLIDFGIAKYVTGTALNQTGTIVGTAEYMAPEQTRGQAIPASDLFSLGVTCVHLLTGIKPWTMYQAIEDKWYWRSFLGNQKVSERLGKILDKLLQSSVSLRYQSADQVLADLYSKISINHSKQPDTFSHVWGKVKDSIGQMANQLMATLNEENRSASPPTPINSGTEPRSLGPRLSSGDNATTLLRDENSPNAIEKELDCQTLESLLSKKKWQAADLETWQLLCNILNKPHKTYLFADDVRNLSINNLQKIDLLWIKYSQGKFGFSIQSAIYESVQRDYGQFCEQVGWLTYNTHNPAAGFQYKLSSPKGHLPSRIWFGGTKWWLHAELMANKLAEL